jgi:RNA polymerase sigma-70 factor, ECF subfamily
VSQSGSRKRRSSSSTDYSKWFRLAQDQATGALNQLLDLYRPLLLKLAQRQIAPELQAKVRPSDLVQATVWKATNAFSDSEFESRQRFERWLVTILKNEARNGRREFLRTRKRSILREQPLEAAETNPSLARLSAKLSSLNLDLAARREWQDVLRVALARLPKHYRYVLNARYLRNRDFATIATQLGRSYDGTRMLCRRALSQLRDQIESMQRNGEAPNHQTNES